MSDSPNNTATVAAQVINEIGGTSEAATVRSNSATDTLAAHRPDIAQAEIASMLRDQDPENYTARIAAINIHRADSRNWEATAHGNVRREHIPSGYGNELTSRLAREVIDFQSAADERGIKVKPADKRALAIQQFTDSNREAALPHIDAAPGTPEYYKAANAVIDALIRKGRNGR